MNAENMKPFARKKMHDAYMLCDEISRFFPTRDIELTKHPIKRHIDANFLMR